MNNKLKLKSEVNVGVRGYFKVLVTKEDGTVTHESVTDNIVTDYGIRDLLYPASSSIEFQGPATGTSGLYVGIGTGSTETISSSTMLSNYLQVFSTRPMYDLSTTSSDNLDGTDTVQMVLSYSFPLGSVVNTISEVGVFESSGNSGNNLVAGQLIKDEFGNPTTVTILSDEQLRIEYTLEFTVPNTSQKVAELTANIAGSNHLVELYQNAYSAGYDAPSRALYWSRQTSTNERLQVNSSSVGSSDYSLTKGQSGSVENGYVRTYSLVLFPSAGPYVVNPISRIRTMDGGTSNTNPTSSIWTHRIEITPGIPKTNEQAFYIDWEVTYKFTRA